jgi:hypothetical protein
MTKFIFAVLVAAIAASPAAAQTKKAKQEAAAPVAEPVAPRAPTEAENTNQNSLNLAKDSLPVFLPSWSLPAYMAITKPAQTPPQQ